MKFLRDLFGIDLDKFVIKKQTYKMEVLWTDDNSEPITLFVLSPSWFIFKDKCGYFNPRIGKIILIQKNKNGKVIRETEYNFSSKRFWTIDYYKNQTIEILSHFNHKGESVIERKIITTYRDDRKVAVNYLPY